MLQKLQIHVSALACRLYLTQHVCLLIFVAQSTKKRTQFCPKVSQRTFHEDDPHETPFVPKVMAHKNIRNRSPEEENQMPASKRPRHTGLIGEIDAFTLKDLRGASGEDSSRCRLQEDSSRCPLQEISACTPQRPLEKTASSLLMGSVSSNAPVLSLSLSHNSSIECNSRRAVTGARWSDRNFSLRRTLQLVYR